MLAVFPATLARDFEQPAGGLPDVAGGSEQGAEQCGDGQRGDQADDQRDVPGAVVGERNGRSFSDRDLSQSASGVEDSDTRVVDPRDTRERVGLLANLLDAVDGPRACAAIRLARPTIVITIAAATTTTTTPRTSPMIQPVDTPIRGNVTA